MRSAENIQRVYEPILHMEEEETVVRGPSGSGAIGTIQPQI